MDYSIDELLPHAGKLMLLDRVIEFKAQQLVAEATVRDDGLFNEGNTAPAWLGIEYMAQTVAALGGMKRRLAGKPINLGLLLGTRRYDCNVDRFAVGTVLAISVQPLIQNQGLEVFDCRITADGISAFAKLNVYQSETALNQVMTG